jgi:hypothetical protein
VPTRYNSPGKSGIGCPVLECEVLIVEVFVDEVEVEFDSANEPRPRRADVEALPFQDLRGGSS